MAPTRPKRSKKEERESWRNVGYILVVLLYLGWFQFHWEPGVLAVLSVVLILYGLLAAPVPCCALTRKKLRCRNNAMGLLRGCDVEHHKWQHFKLLLDRATWAEYRRTVFNGIAGNAAALGVIAGFMSAIAAVVMPLITGGA